MFEVSILVIAHDADRFIISCLDSIVRQITDFSFEVVVCDDASCDNTFELILEWKKRNPHTPVNAYSNSLNQGSYLNLYQGLSMCKGQYISVIEGDDLWLDVSKLTTQIMCLRSKSEISAVACGCEFIDIDGSISTQLYYRESKSRLFTNQELWDYPPFQTSGLVFRKSDLPELPQNIPRFNCNDKILYALLSSNKPIWYDATKMVGYRFHNGNLTSNYTRFQNQVSRPLRANWILLKHLGLRYISPFTRAFIKFIYYYVLGSIRPQRAET